MILRNAAARQGRRALAGPVSRSTVRNASTDAPTDPPTEREAPSSQLSFSPQETSAWAASMLAKAEIKSTAPAQAIKIRSSRRKQSKYAQDSVVQLSVDGTIAHRGKRWSKAHELNGQTFSVQQQWKMFKKSQAETKKLGTDLEKRYDPGAILRDPPLPEDITLEMLMAAQTHMGHHTSKWNPANARYIYGAREGTHIIALETTVAHLRRAARVVEEVAYHGGIILFVGTRNGQMEIVSRTAQMAGSYQLFTKWAPGTITNRDVMLDGHATKVVNETDKHLPDFERYDLKSRPLMPDLVVCLNPQENYTMLYECGLATIPTIGIIDTDADPTWVTYGIPANDDSLRSVALISGVLGRAGQRGQERRMTDSVTGNVPWQTPAELKKHIAAERAQIDMQRKRLKAMLAHTQGLNEEEDELVKQQETRQKMTEAMNEDAMLSIMGQAAAGETKGKQKKPVQYGEITADSFQRRTAGIDKRLRSHYHQAKTLTAEIEEALSTMYTTTSIPPTPAIPVDINLKGKTENKRSTDDIDGQLQSQLAEAEKLQADLTAAGTPAPVVEELSAAAKKRRELEALFSGKTKL